MCYDLCGGRVLRTVSGVFVLFVSDGVLGGWTAVCFPVRGLSTKVIPVEGSGFTRN